MNIKTQLHVPKLTKRETEVLRMACEGKQCKVIADELCMSLRTVEEHRRSIRNKLLPGGGSYTGEQLGVIAYSMGLLRP